MSPSLEKKIMLLRLGNFYFLLHRRIGLVGQEPVLFSGTIGENIRMGRKEGVSTEEMLKSSEMANAAEFISKVYTVIYLYPA